MADYADVDILVDAVMEWYAMRWTKSQIKRQLREEFSDITVRAIESLLTMARRKIRELYGINPQEYKGRQIAFYEAIIRRKNKTRDKLTAAERLDKLFGLENVQGGDPATQAREIRKQIAEMEATMPDFEEADNGDTKHDGESQTDNAAESNESGTDENVEKQTGRDTTNFNSKENNIEPEDCITDDDFSEGLLEILDTIKDKEIEQFRTYRDHNEAGQE